MNAGKPLNLRTTLLLSTCILTIFCVPVRNPHAQRRVKTTAPCVLELKDAPTIRGLRLGMALNEFLEMFPSAKAGRNSRPEVGATSYEINQAEHPNFVDKSTKLDFVWFVDERLSSVGFKYPEFEPVSINDFVRQAAAKLGLPSIGWKNFDGLPNPKILRCRYFEVMIGRESFRAGIGDPYIILSDKVADAKIIARENELKRKDVEERRRKEREKRIFKP